MTSNRWVVTADERVARLVHVERNERGRLCVEDQAMITDAWEEHEHGRPSPLSREGGGTYASIGHEQETRLARFAKEIAEWLERELAERGVDQIAVFAPPHFLGALRKAWTPRFALQVEEQQLINQRGLNTRSNLQLLRVARTITDLNDTTSVDRNAVAEASCFSCTDLLKQPGAQ